MERWLSWKTDTTNDPFSFCSNLKVNTPPPPPTDRWDEGDDEEGARSWWGSDMALTVIEGAIRIIRRQRGAERSGDMFTDPVRGHSEKRYKMYESRPLCSAFTKIHKVDVV